MTRLVALSPVLLVGCSACGAPARTPPGRAAQPAEARRTAAAPGSPAPPSAASEPPAALRHVVCSWGGVGPRGDPPPAWVVGLVDLEARETLVGLAVERVELLDAEGAAVAATAAELELRRSPEGRGELDFSRYGTLDLGPRVEPGAPVRLWHHGRLDRSHDEVAARSPTRYRATFRTAGGRHLSVEGPLDPSWPTG